MALSSIWTSKPAITGFHAGLPGSTAERDACQHWVRRAARREERGPCNVAIGGVVHPPEVVGHGIGNIVAHARGAGVVVCGSEVVASILECSERGKAPGASAR